MKAPGWALDDYLEATSVRELILHVAPKFTDLRSGLSADREFLPVDMSLSTLTKISDWFPNAEAISLANYRYHKPESHGELEDFVCSV